MMKNWARAIICGCCLSLIEIGVFAQTDNEIAYLAFTDGFWQVWTMGHDNGTPKQVSNSPYEKSRLSWFSGEDALLICGNQGQLAKLNLLTGQETKIDVPLMGIQDAVVSPNGKQIAFSLSTADSIDDNNIWIANIDGTSPKKLTNMPALQHDPVWSPDGSALYFVSGPGGQSHDIWKLALEQKRVEQLTFGQLYNFDIAISTKGDLVFSSNRSGNYELWHLPEGKPPKVLTTHPGLDAKPSFSPAGDQIVFESSRSGRMNIWVLDLTNNQLKQLTDHAKGARSPVWRPVPDSTQHSKAITQ